MVTTLTLALFGFRIIDPRSKVIVTAFTLTFAADCILALAYNFGFIG